MARHGADASVHLERSRGAGGWRNEALAEKRRGIRTVRRVVGALEIERANKKIGPRSRRIR